MREMYEDMREEYAQDKEPPKVQVTLEDAMKDLGLSGE